MPRKSKYQLELEERRRNPGGYIGEAMDAIMPRRKPRPFMCRSRMVARCAIVPDTKYETRYIETRPHALMHHDARRLSRWLADAADWVEEGR